MIAAGTERPVAPSTATESIVVEVRGLSQRYGDLEALREISFSVRQNEIFGLIGPDGAGKTSTFQILAGVMEASSGDALVFGRPAREMRGQTGYLTQSFSLYPDLTIAENIRYCGDLRKIPSSEIMSRGQQYLRMFDMDRFSNRLAGKLSGGMKQKLSLACVLVPQPRILILDEPTTGVDPVSRREFWDALGHLSAEGLTIIVATPYLDEAERCHRIAFIHGGEILQIGTPSELSESLGAKRLQLVTPHLAEAEKLLTARSGSDKEILDVQRFGDRLDVLVADPAREQSRLRKQLRDAGITVTNVIEDRPTLENTVVARLRALGHNPPAGAFPTSQGHSGLRHQVAVGAKDLLKQFGAFTAVHNVSLQIQHGEVYGLLGANGAGKTTIIRMLCGLLDPTSGTVELGGTKGDLRAESLRKRIGYMSQKFSLYGDLSIRENLEFYAGVYGVPPMERADKIRWVLSFSGLEGRDHQITSTLPGGWKQRVAFGSAIMHEPDILFLDEPTSGVDPLARRSFWTMINRLADSGAAILVTTHYLEEAEQCNRLGMMVAGELVAEGTPTAIKSIQSGHLVQLLVDHPQQALQLLQQGPTDWRVSLFGSRLHIVSEASPDLVIQQATALLAVRGLQVISAREDRFSLEDVFISIVESARGEGKVAAEH